MKKLSGKTARLELLMVYLLRRETAEIRRALNWTIFNVPHILRYDSTLPQEMDSPQSSYVCTSASQVSYSCYFQLCTLSHTEAMFYNWEWIQEQ